MMDDATFNKPDTANSIFNKPDNIIVVRDSINNLFHSDDSCKTLMDNKRRTLALDIVSWLTLLLK